MPELPLQYEDFLRASVDWTWECDSNFKIAALSSGFSTILGRPGEDFYGKTLWDLFKPAPKGNEVAACSLHSMLLGRQSFRHHRVQVTERGESTRLILVNGLPYYDDSDGQFMGFRGTAVQMPSRELYDAEDSEANQRLLGLLEIALKRKDELENNRSTDEALLEAKSNENRYKLGPLAHELKTPLNAILGFSEIIRDQRVGTDLEQYSEYARLIHESGAHLLEVIEDLLELAETGGDKETHLATESVDPSLVARFTLSVLEDTARCEQVTLIDRLPRDLPPIRIEQRKLRQILLNLVTNAIKYTPEGGKVTLSAEIDEGVALRLIVSDTGIGIRQEDRERIFKRNVQTTEAQQIGDGRGLGLSIASDLASAFGGNITVESTAGVGSRFTLNLPISDPPHLKNEIAIARKRENKVHALHKDMH